jgi:arylsulfatase A-like enzyme
MGYRVDPVASTDSSASTLVKPSSGMVRRVHSDHMSTPNVMLLVVDALRADAVFESPPETPTLDGLCERGAAFVQCISTATSTSPSFASMLTGCYPTKHQIRGLKGHTLSPTVKTAAEIFSANGYSTAAWVGGPLLPQTHILRGFDDVTHIGGNQLPFVEWRGDVLDKMATLPSPWFFLLHVWEVHPPYRPPPTHRKRRGRKGYVATVEAVDRALKPIIDALPPNTILVVTGDHGEKLTKSWIGDRSPAVAKEIRRRVGRRRLPNKIQRALGNRSIGHGDALFESLVRVPLLITGPGIKKRVITDQVRHVDLVSTLAELVGIQPPGDLDGRSLRSALRGRRLSPRPAYLEATGVAGESPIYGVRTPEWKLLRGRGTKPELYSLSKDDDGAEKRNVYSRYPDVVKELEAFLNSQLDHGVIPESGMTRGEEETLEKHLRDLGYL